MPLTVGEYVLQRLVAWGEEMAAFMALLAVRYPREVNLTGDSKETLQALIPLLGRKQDSLRSGWSCRVPKRT